MSRIAMLTITIPIKVLSRAEVRKFNTTNVLVRTDDDDVVILVSMASLKRAIRHFTEGTAHMTRTEAKLEAGSLTGTEPAAPEMIQSTRLRILTQSLPNGDPVESAVFAAVFVKELEAQRGLLTALPGFAYLKAVQALAAFRAADRDYREGRLGLPP